MVIADPPLGALDDLRQALGDFLLGRRNAVAQRVGAVADQRQHALVAELAEALLVGQGAERGVEVDLPVAGVDHRSERRLDRQRHRLGDRVVDADRLDLERADIDAIALLEDRHRDFGAAALVVALGLEHAGGKGRGIDRHVQARPEIVQGAVVILVGMGDDDALEVPALLGEKADVGQDEIDARQVRDRER